MFRDFHRESWGPAAGRGEKTMLDLCAAVFVVCFSVVLFSAAAFADPAEQPGQTKFDPTWDSLRHYAVPEWYLDAKFGIFIHWGVYSVPAFGNEWYPRNMYVKGQRDFEHHVKTYGDQSQFGYKDFVPRFKAEKWSPEEWARLFKRSGAQYVVPVAEHHDGFAMYDCGLCEWNAMKMGPKRDIIGELAQAVRKEGMVFGLSSHRAEHWWFFNGGRQFESDVKTGQWDALYGPAQPEGTQPDTAFLENWLARCCELVDKYEPQVFWFDWWIEQPAFAPYRQKFAAYYYNRAAEWGRGVAINYKNVSFPPEAAVLDIERGKLDETRDLFWQTDTSISILSWGYVENDRFRSVGSLVHELVDIVSKNGCLLLNIGPKPDGTIPQEAQEILLGIGDWLRINGEAIYGTRPWLKHGEGPTETKSGSFSDASEKGFTAEDVRFTAKGDTVYAICMGWPKESFRIASLGAKHMPAAKIREVSMMGAPEKLTWVHQGDALVVNAPATRPCGNAYVLKITFQGRGFGDLDVTSDVNNEITASLPARNYDAEPWSEEISLQVNGRVAETKRVDLAPHACGKIVLSARLDKPGVYSVAVGAPGWTSASRAVLAPGISLAGEWRFKKGDDAKWSALKVNESDWETVTLPAAWEDHSNYTEDNVYGWYRKTEIGRAHV